MSSSSGHVELLLLRPRRSARHAAGSRKHRKSDEEAALLRARPCSRITPCCCAPKQGLDPALLFR
jgi:hypothetical protein